MKIPFLKYSFVLGLAIKALSLSAQTNISASNDKIQYMGRIDFSNPEQPTYIYPGVSIKAKFNGAEITAIIEDYGDGSDASGNFYKILIDGQIVNEQLKVATGEANYLLASGLTPAEHTVELMKITEGASGKSSFKGFIITGGSEDLLTPDSASQKRIEFIGDSWTCGYGNVSQFASGPASMAYSNYYAANEDNYYAWGPITARALGAQYHVTATSGRGLYRNNTGTTTHTIPKNYDHLFEDDASVIWDHSKYHPDVISIHLGTNDMAQEEGGEEYKLDDEAFQQTYIDFITKLRAYHPCSKIIICFGNSKSDSWPTWTQQLTRLRTIANQVADSFTENVTTLELPFTAEKWTGNPEDDCGYGDAWHPSKCSHEEMAVELINKINSLNVEWGKSNCMLSTYKPIEEEIVKIYPNPAYSKVLIHTASNESLEKVTITDMTGKIVKQLETQNSTSEIDVTTLPKGIYFVKVGNTTQKLIKK